MDRTPCPGGKILLLSAEDDVEDTIRPRLDAAGADPRRVYALEAVFDVNEEGTRRRRMLNLARDIECLDEVLSSGGLRLVIVDPVSAYLGGVDTHRNADLRAVLAPLAELAARHKVAMVVCPPHKRGRRVCDLSGHRKHCLCRGELGPPMWSRGIPKTKRGDWSFL